MNMKFVLVPVILSFLLGHAFAAEYQGRFESERTVVYFVHKGGPLEFNIRIAKVAEGFRGSPPLRVTESALFTLSDPEEKVIEKEYWRKVPGEDGKTWTFRYEHAAPGVWQLRTTLSSNSNLALEFGTTPALAYGTMFSRCRIYASDFKQFNNHYFLVPPPLAILGGAAEKVPLLRLTSRGIQTDVFDAEGRPLLSCDIFQISGARSEIHGNSDIDLPFGAVEVSRDTEGATLVLNNAKKQRILELAPDNSVDLHLQAGETYQLKISGAAKGWITIEGLPAILCPDLETLNQIGGSVHRDEDGKAYPHKFQLEIKRWMRSLTESDFAVEAVPLTRYKEHWLADPANKPLILPFAYAGHLFKVQSTSLPEAIKHNDAPVNLDALILFYTLDKPFNPYFKNPAVMNRMYHHYLKKWLCLTESGFMWDDPRGYYCGGTEWSGAEGMLFCKESLALMMGAPYADKKLTELLMAGLALNLHCLWNARLTCENQSLHWPLKTYALWRVTGEKIYLDMARDYLADVADPALSRGIKAGYLTEALGADCTYSGISTSLLALAARLSGDDAALPLLELVFELMSYTITREPDGSLSGVNGFAHRTLGTWLNRQYDGGAELLSDKFESAALVNKRTDPDRAELEKEFATYSSVSVPEDIKPWIPGGENMFRYSFTSFDRIWRNSLIKLDKDIANPKTPAEQSTSFERHFSDEFVAKRTPAYYAFFYTGNPDWRSRHWRSIQSPFPEGSELENGQIHSKEASRPWMPMQGMNIFWTPAFGKFVSAHNWTMYSQNLVRLERAGKVVDFPTCYSAESRNQHGRIDFKHASKFEGLRFRRGIEPTTHSVKVEINVSAPGAIRPCQLIEQIPYLLKRNLAFSSMDGKVRSLRASLPSGAGVLLEFDRPVTIRQGPVSTATFNSPDMRIGLLEIVFEQNFDGSAESQLNYEIKADDK